MKSIYYTGLNTSNGQEKVILNINIIKTFKDYKYEAELNSRYWFVIIKFFIC